MQTIIRHNSASAAKCRGGQQPDFCDRGHKFISDNEMVSVVQKVQRKNITMMMSWENHSLVKFTPRYKPMLVLHDLPPMSMKVNSSAFPIPNTPWKILEGCCCSPHQLLLFCNHRSPTSWMAIHNQTSVQRVQRQCHRPHRRQLLR